ncbi:mediator of RNA polymerase II transcription subunit 2-like [Eurytemora carolleeae]|uniref:mediator of RNA polymerase II transcription subunit 2-like n=1 Tax=Eurytemora carolleeae TaxID=1294199 RepID=UPI000C7719DC|nr:mediator of RNA polymerase II transcription subunit 2-like [Eurytemora carolleeae]|eukprot:XP_023322658.1 mediator of RNA polymerase II transcription subunit 2-like [Eurytemora affinis]
MDQIKVSKEWGQNKNKEQEQRQNKNNEQKQEQNTKNEQKHEHNKNSKQEQEHNKNKKQEEEQKKNNEQEQQQNKNNEQEHEENKNKFDPGIGVVLKPDLSGAESLDGDGLDGSLIKRETEASPGANKETMGAQSVDAMSIGTGGSTQDKYSSSYKTPNYTQYTDTNFKEFMPDYKSMMSGFESSSSENSTNSTSGGMGGMGFGGMSNFLDLGRKVLKI